MERVSAERFKYRGNKALAEGNADGAIKHYSNAIKLETQNRHVLFSNRSAAYVKARRYVDALNDAKTTVEMKPAWATGYLRKGTALAFLGRLQFALDAFEVGLAYEPDNQQLQEAIKDVKRSMRILKLFPTNPFADLNEIKKLAVDARTTAFFNDPSYVRLMVDLEKSPSMLSLHLEDTRVQTTLSVLTELSIEQGFEEMDLSPPDEPETIGTPELSPPKPENKLESTPKKTTPEKEQAQKEKEAGNEAFKRRDFATALQHYNGAAALDPTDTTILYNIAAVYFRRNENDKCIKQCEEAVELGWKNRADLNIIAKGYDQIATVYCRRKNYHMAKVFFYKKFVTEYGTPDTRAKLSEVMISFWHQEKNYEEPRRKRKLVEVLQPTPLKPEQIPPHFELRKLRNAIEQMNYLVDGHKLDEDETTERNQFADEIYNILRNCFEFCRVEIVGSTESGLARHGSDLDLSASLLPDEIVREPWQVCKLLTDLQLDDRLKRVAEGSLITVEEVKMLRTKTIGLLMKNFVSKHHHVKNIIYIYSKWAPKLTFCHKKLNINCHVFIINRMAVHSTALTRLYAQLDRRAYLLFYTVRCWAKENRLTGCDVKNFTNYAIVMLVVFFLQNTNPPVLPTVQELRNMAPVGSERLTNGMDCTFCDEPSAIPESGNTQSPDCLLRQFFKFYSNFDFGSFALCPRVGDVTPKLDLIKTNNLQLIANDSGVCIQDPFILDHNLTESVSDEVVGSFIIAVCKSAVVAGNDQAFLSDLGPRNWGILAFGPQVLTHVSVKKRDNRVQRKMCLIPLYIPESVTKSSRRDAKSPSHQVAAERMHWCKMFRRILVAVLEKVLKFECTSFVTSESSQGTTDGRPASETEYYQVDESGQHVGSSEPLVHIDSERKNIEELFEFMCTVRYNTLIDRQTIASESVMANEESISKAIMELPESLLNPPLSLKCRVTDIEGHAGLIVALLPLLGLPATVNSVLKSLKVYMPAFLAKYCDEIWKK